MIKKISVLLLLPRYSLHSTPFYEYRFPLGIPYLAAILRDSKIDVDGINLNHESGTTEDIINAALSKKCYDIVGTGGTCLDFYEVKKIIDIAQKHHTHPTTVLGGMVVTAEPQIVFEAIHPDYGIIGNGEISFLNLIRKIVNNSSEDINGIIFRKEGQTVITPPQHELMPLDQIPFPDYEKFGLYQWMDNTTKDSDFRIFSVLLEERPRVYSVMGGRGCPFNCTFCFHFEKYRERSLDNIFAEIEMAIEKYQANSFYLLDDCFSTHRKRVLEFCNRMEKLQQKTGKTLLWASQFSVVHVDDELLTRCKESGCCCIMYGFESYDRDVLKSMKKPITPEDIDRAITLTIQHKIAVIGCFIFGDVAETNESYMKTLNYWRSKCTGRVELGIIQPYPGSLVYKKCIDMGLIHDKLDFLSNKMGKQPILLNFTQKMNNHEYKKMTETVVQYYFKYNRIAVAQRTVRKAKNLLAFDYKCPFCNTNNHIENIKCRFEFAFSFHLSCKYCLRSFYVSSFTHRYIVQPVINFLKLFKLDKYINKLISRL